MLPNVHTIYLSILLIICSGLPLSAQSGFNADRAFEDLQAQCDLGPRNPNSDGAEAAIQFFSSILGPLADTLHLQNFRMDDPYSTEQLNLTNIVARFQPQKNPTDYPVCPLGYTAQG